MKKTAITIITGVALAATAQAGDDYSAKGGKAVIPPPAPCLWTWFAGGSIGEVDGDWDESIYTAHLGKEYRCPDQSCTHSIFLEVGWTEKDENFSIARVNQGLVPTRIGANARSVNLEAEIIPITINYKYECVLTGGLNGYIGAGAGIALVDLDINSNVGTSLSEDDTVFYAHIFAGLTYNFSESFEIFGGVRYIFMDDPNLTGFAPFDNQVELDGDLHYEIGARFNF
ncbi:MAG: outer membrane protein [Akkermansiaceae bacterium]